jgi:cytochrome d ubiquinol oxidase subunit I
MVALGGALSAAFIMAANSWMQNPVGYAIDPATDRAQLTEHRRGGVADRAGDGGAC